MSYIRDFTVVISNKTWRKGQSILGELGQFYLPADALAPCSARSSAAMVLSAGTIRSLSPLRKDFSYLQYFNMGSNKCNIDGFVQDCNNFSVLAMEFLQSRTKPIDMFCSSQTIQQI